MYKKTSQLSLGSDLREKAPNSHRPSRPSTISIVRLQMVRERTIKYANNTISGPQQLAELVHDYLGVPNREHFVAVCLDSKNKPTHIETVSIGTINFSLVSPAEVYKLALNSNAAGVAVAHNHPSGNPEPSHEDIKITHKLVEAGEIMGIPVLDHVIIGNAPGVFYSFKEHALL